MWTGIVNNDSKLSVLPDKVVGLAGLLAVTKPLKVSSSYRRRRIVCKRYFDGKHVLNLPFTPVRRKVYRRPLGFIPRPLLERAIQDEIEHRAECAAQGKAVITKPKQLSPAARHQAKAAAYGHVI